MNAIALSDTSWHFTFPHRLSPLSDEWLAGLLLRCDEINHWGSRTTLTHLLTPGPEKFHRCWRTESPYLVLIQPSSLNLDYLAQRLSLPISTLFATTYHAELLRLCNQVIPHPRLLGASFTFHLCPACLREARLLRRILTLPGISHCPQHQVALHALCRCGAPLRLFRAATRPFTCASCGLDWADLPQIEAKPTAMLVERKRFIWYEFFFSRGTLSIMRVAQQLMMGLSRERIALGDLVAWLVKRDHAPQDLLNRML